MRDMCTLLQSQVVMTWPPVLSGNLVLFYRGPALGMHVADLQPGQVAMVL